MLLPISIELSFCQRTVNPKHGALLFYYGYKKRKHCRGTVP